MSYVNEIINKHCHQLKGIEHLDGNGFVNIHSNSRKAQATSSTCLNTLRRLGYKFDIRLYDGTVISNVDINEVKVKVEYNIPPSVDTLAPNALVAWRPVPAMPLDAEGNVYKSCDVELSQAFSKGPLTEKDFVDSAIFRDVEFYRVPHYANDKYKREIKPGVFVDVYDVIDCYEVTNGALQHALKKILATGKRGHKTFEQDLIDILSSVERALFQHQEKSKL